MFGHLRVKICLVALVLLGAVSTPVLAQEPDLCELVKTSNDRQSWSHQVVRSFCELPSFIPYRNILIKWANIFNPLEYAHVNEVSSENRGLITYFQQKIYDDPKFGGMIKQFSAEVTNRLTKDQAATKLIYSEDKSKFPLGSRPSLSESAGEGRYSHIEKGIIWQLALKAAQGNQRTALDIIGACGSDDIMTQYYSPATADARKEMAERRRHLKTQLEQLYTQQGSASGLEETVSYTHKISDAKNQFNKWVTEQVTQKRFEPVYCPSTYLFIPKSLGAEVDISPELKQKIAKTQAPTKGASFLPAKYYHVNMSAFSVCQLVILGMPAYLAKKYQSWFAWAYREVSLESQLNQMMDLYDKAKGEFEAVNGEIKGQEMREKFLESFRASVFKYFSSMDTGLENIDENLRKEISQQFEKLSYSIVDRVHGGILLKEWARPISIFGFGFKYSNQLVMGPKNLLGPDAQDAEFKPVDWSDERFQKAKRTLATWLVDWEWTVAQHTVGAEFGVEMCSE